MSKWTIKCLKMTPESSKAVVFNLKKGIANGMQHTWFAYDHQRFASCWPYQDLMPFLLCWYFSNLSNFRKDHNVWNKKNDSEISIILNFLKISLGSRLTFGYFWEKISSNIFRRWNAHFLCSNMLYWVSIFFTIRLFYWQIIHWLSVFRLFFLDFRPSFRPNFSTILDILKADERSFYILFRHNQF